MASWPTLIGPRPPLHRLLRDAFTQRKKDCSLQEQALTIEEGDAIITAGKAAHAASSIRYFAGPISAISAPLQEQWLSFSLYC